MPTCVVARVYFAIWACADCVARRALVESVIARSMRPDEVEWGVVMV